MLVLQEWHKQENRGTFFIDSSKIKSEAEFLISSGTFSKADWLCMQYHLGQTSLFWDFGIQMCRNF